MSDIDTMLAEIKRLDAEASAASSAPMPECNCCGDEHDECLDDCAHEQWKLRLGKALRARGEYYRTAAPALAAEVERLRAEVARLTLDNADLRVCAECGCCPNHDKCKAAKGAER